MYAPDEMVKEFLVESHDNLDQLDRDLISLEQDPTCRDTLSSVFRTIHTIKGTCGFLGFGKLESLAHVGENLLSKLREGELTLNADITSGLLAQVDAIRAMLQNIEQIGNEGENEYAEVRERLAGLQVAGIGDGESAIGEQAAASVPQVEGSDDLCEASDAPPTNMIGDVLVHQGLATPEAVATALELQAGGDKRPLGEILTAKRETSAEQVAEALKTQHDARLSDGSIRVDVGLLDKLMNRVGELVLARNQILQFTSQLEDSTFLSTCQRLNLITTELQEGVMKTRMQPIDNVWNKFPRVVRDLAVQCGKQVRIEMEGKQTELDKTIIEAIKDPLTHLVRNSVDHGIEKPQDRAAASKNPEGCLQLRAYHEGGQVNIEISDDGAGLNLERIKQKAIERGLITADQAMRMGERELSMLIFRPGFSTAEKITNVSGRGVGMDVVKTNIEKIGGAVDIQSQLGQGTTIKIKIPLTLAIIPALIVTSGGQRYAIPQVSLLELVRLEGEQARKSIERMHDAPVYRLRGQLLPLVYLNQQLEIEPIQTQGAQAGSGITNIVVLRADDRQFGLVVDSINDTEEIVVKPLSKQLKAVSVFAGATIMGDGAVALILDVLGMAQRARVVSEVRERAITSHGAGNQDRAGDRQSLLVLCVGDRRVALPISMISRLEELPQSQVEIADNREVVQYRGQILPIVRLAEALGVPSRQEEDRPLQVVVYSEQGRSVGLVVDRIADIADSAIKVQRQTQNPDLTATAVIQDRVTDLLNLPSIIRRLDPSFYDVIPSA